MANYNPNIPQPNDLISVSQGELLTNFTQLNTQFGIDHTAFFNGSANGDGFHKKVTYNVPQTSDPSVSGTSSVLYTKAVSGVAQLFFTNSTGVTQITGVSTAAGNGTAFLPGGIIIKWGTSAAIAGPPGNFAYPTPMPNNTFSAVVVGNANSYTFGFVVKSLTAAGFVVTRTDGGTGSTGYNYIAIGN